MNEVDEILAATQRYERIGHLLVNAGSMARGHRVFESAVISTAQKYPRWPSGVDRVDGLDAPLGGFYGLTMIAGGEGAGKSLLALVSSLLAAELGWCVCYFDAENSDRTVADRFFRYYGDLYAGDKAKSLAGYWHRFPVLPGAKRDELVEHVLRAYSSRHTGLLIVLDSLSTLAEMGVEKPQETHLALLNYLFWIDALVRKSHGFVSVLAISELNAAEGLKGRKAAYTASMVLRLVAQDESGDVVRIGVTKSRDGRRADVGLHTRAWQSSRFEPVPDVTK